MVYVALLRGINVGGKNKVNMKALKATFEAADMDGVTTFINSGNVIFRSRSRSPKRLASNLEAAIESDFGFAVKVLLRDLDQMRATVAKLPASWVNDETMRCDVIFLWDGIDDRAILQQVPARPKIDTVRYVPGALLWRIPRAQINKSRMNKLAGTDLYKQMTIRNCNTARRVLALMESAQ